METTFFSPLDLLGYFKTKDLREELNDNSSIGVCSIADLLYMTEYHKTGEIPISSNLLSERFSNFISLGITHVAELDQDRLSSSLFDRTADNIVTGMCSKSAVMTISPRRSLRQLSLKISDETAWWSEKVLDEMEQYSEDETE